MRNGILAQIAALLLVVTILGATAVGFCNDVHASEVALCSQCGQQSGVSVVASLDGHCHSCPDAEDSGPDHGTTSCYCSCHLPAPLPRIQIRYSPEIIVHCNRYTPTPPQDIFLSLFVPPDSLA
jgi:hypothetical protein